MKPLTFGILVTIALGLLVVPAAVGAEITTLQWPVPPAIPGTTESHAILHTHGQGYWPIQEDGTEKLEAHKGLDFIRMSQPGLPYYFIPPGSESTWDQVKAMAQGRVLYKQRIVYKPDGSIANVTGLVLTLAHDSQPEGIVSSTYNGNGWEYRHVAYGMNPETNREWDVGDVATFAPGTTDLPFLGVVAKSEHHAPHLHMDYVKQGMSGWGDAIQLDNPLKFLIQSEETFFPEIAFVRILSVDDSGIEGPLFPIRDGAGRTIVRGNAQLLVQSIDRFDSSGARIGVNSLGFGIRGPVPYPCLDSDMGNEAVEFKSSFVCEGSDCGLGYVQVLYDNRVYPPGPNGDSENKVSPFPGFPPCQHE